MLIYYSPLTFNNSTNFSIPQIHLFVISTQPSLLNHAHPMNCALDNSEWKKNFGALNKCQNVLHSQKR